MDGKSCGVFQCSSHAVCVFISHLYLYLVFVSCICICILCLFFVFISIFVLLCREITVLLILVGMFHRSTFSFCVSVFIFFGNTGFPARLHFGCPFTFNLLIVCSNWFFISVFVLFMEAGDSGAWLCLCVPMLFPVNFFVFVFLLRN